MNSSGHSPNIERYTPREIFIGLNCLFSLDPCAPLEYCPSHDYCGERYILPQNGLELPWEGRVWLNPPFHRNEVKKWISKLAQHGDGIALVTSYFTSSWFQENPPDGLFLLADRPRYIVPKKDSSTVTGRYPSMLMSYGADCTEILKYAKLKGHFYRFKGGQ
jgi:hypothetical protein